MLGSSGDDVLPLLDFALKGDLIDLLPPCFGFGDYLRILDELPVL